MTSRYFRLALTGHPLGHSLSPVIHQAALASTGLQGEYSLQPVPPLEGQIGLEKLTAQLRAGDLQGLNVTIPHKQAIRDVCDRLTPLAARVQAVNLLFMEAGQLVGDNVDVPGFLAGLDQLSGSPRAKGKALVLGAGGSARAVVCGLEERGWQVTLAVRRPQQARELASDLGHPGIPVITLERDALGALQVDLLVNTTPLGMSPHPAGSPWPEDLPFPTRTLVYDLIYNPFRTRLMAQAEAAGNGTLNGLTMLVEQAALSFLRWTGQNPDRKTMEAAAIAALEQRNQAETA